MRPIELLIAAVRAVAAERSEYLYTKPEGEFACVYWNPADGSCSCIFGHAMARVHIGGAAMSVLDTVRAWPRDESLSEKLGWNQQAIGIILTRLGWDTTYNEMSWCARVQTQQDFHGETWSQAVETADRIYPLS